MILALDVGNTNIVIGCIEDGKIISDGRMSTDHTKTADEYAIQFKMILEMNQMDLAKVEGAIISSVVPPITNALVKAIEKISGVVPLVVSGLMKTGLTIKTYNPTALGADLIVGAVAAMHEHPLPLMIFDMGTATTCSVIDKEANYLGGMIFPGVKVAADALSSHAAQLPYISFEAPEKVVGSNTVDCMKSGIIYGNAARWYDRARGRRIR